MRDRRRKKIEAKERPKPLPDRRQSLSEPRAKRDLFGKRISPAEVIQTGPLLRKLPAELRCQIFSYVFSTSKGVLHVFNATYVSYSRAEVKHIVCGQHKHTEARDNPDDPNMACEGCSDSDGSLPMFLKPGIEDHPGLPIVIDKHPGMGLLKSCRQAYKECINMLYTSNTLSFPNPITFHYFTQTVLPHRLAEITGVELRWNIPDCEAARYEAIQVNRGGNNDPRPQFDPFIGFLRSPTMPKVKDVRIIVQWDHIPTHGHQDRLWRSLGGWTDLERLDIVVMTTGRKIPLDKLGEEIVACAIKA